MCIHNIIIVLNLLLLLLLLLLNTTLNLRSARLQILCHSVHQILIDLITVQIPVDSRGFFKLDVKFMAFEESLAGEDLVFKLDVLVEVLNFLVEFYLFHDVLHGGLVFSEDFWVYYFFHIRF